MSDVVEFLPGDSDHWHITWMWREQTKPQDVSTLAEVPLHRRVILALERAGQVDRRLTLDEAVTFTTAWGHRAERIARHEREWLDRVSS